MGTSAIPTGLLLAVQSVSDTSDIAGYPENPTGLVVVVKFARKLAAQASTAAQLKQGNFTDPFAGPREVEMTLNPTHFEYTTSISAMSELRITVPDPEYEVINHLILEEDLATDVTVRFGYLEGSNMSPPIQMVFYKQEPNFPADGAVETTLVCYDHMIFFTLPFEPTTIERPEGISIKDMVELVSKEVMEAYGRKLDVNIDPSLDEKRWWRMHRVGRENVRAPSVHNTALTGLARATTTAKTKVGSPLEFMYGLLALASGPNQEPIDLFVENGALFFRPSMRGVRKVIAHYRYFSELDSSNPQFNRLLSFQPEVNMKPRLIKTRTMDTATGAVDEAESDNDEDLNRTNLTPKQNAVRTVNIQTGKHAMVQVEQGSQAGDAKGKQSAPKQRQKSYTVKSGDNLDAVAKKLGVQADLLISWNHLTPDGSTDRTKVVLKPRTTLTYFLAEPDDPQQPKVTTPEQQARANRAYLTDEYKGVKAKALVEGHPALKAGWPIYIDNVGAKWEGPWFIEEVKHTYDSGGYFCDLSLSRDGFMIAREAGDNSGYNAADDLTPDDPTKAEPVAVQEQKMRTVNIQTGKNTTVTKQP